MTTERLTTIELSTTTEPLHNRIVDDGGTIKYDGAFHNNRTIKSLKS